MWFIIILFASRNITNHCTYILFNTFSNFSRQKHWSQSLHSTELLGECSHVINWDGHSIWYTDGTGLTGKFHTGIQVGVKFLKFTKLTNLKVRKNVRDSKLTDEIELRMLPVYHKIWLSSLSRNAGGNKSPFLIQLLSGRCGSWHSSRSCRIIRIRDIIQSNICPDSLIIMMSLWLLRSGRESWVPKSAFPAHSAWKTMRSRVITGDIRAIE